jgi:hypothetical protein
VFVQRREDLLAGVQSIANEHGWISALARHQAKSVQQVLERLHSSLAQKGQYEAILFPDNPFPGARVEIAKGGLRGNDVNDLVPRLP